MNTTIIYHRADLDGFCSGAIAREAFPDSTMVGLDYGDPIPWDLIEDRNIIMLDFSLEPWKEMKNLGRLAKEIFWIDHHATAIDRYMKDPPFISSKDKSTLRVGVAACELAWGKFQPNSPLPRAVELLSLYDVWRHHEDPDALPFQMGARTWHLDPSTDRGMENWRTLWSSGMVVASVIEQGRVVLGYQEQQNEKLMASAYEKNWRGLDWLVLNSIEGNSLTFQSRFNPERHDAVAKFFFDGSLWRVSLYSPDLSRDLTPIAKSMGGGGHPHACGFQVEAYQKFELL